jgi:hypothetical protein
MTGYFTRSEIMKLPRPDFGNISNRAISDQPDAPQPLKNRCHNFPTVRRKFGMTADFLKDDYTRAITFFQRPAKRNKPLIQPSLNIRGNRLDLCGHGNPTHDTEFGEKAFQAAIRKSVDPVPHLELLDGVRQCRCVNLFELVNH